MNKEELIAKAYAFISYLFRDARIKDRIQRIFLFGSVARNDFTEKSDIDIFIDIEKNKEKQIQKIAQRALNRFEEIEGEKWRLKGLKNKISLKVGFLAEWKLKSSVEREGLVLFSLTPSSRFKKYFLFSLPSISPPKKRIKVIRKLFGRKEKGYPIPGLIQKYEGRILSPRLFLVSSAAQNEISSFLTREKINFSFEEVWQ